MKNDNYWDTSKTCGIYGYNSGRYAREIAGQSLQWVLSEYILFNILLYKRLFLASMERRGLESKVSDWSSPYNFIHSISGLGGKTDK